MATIEGYRFSIDMDDHGMSKKLSLLSKEANTLKRVMRAYTNEAMTNGNTFSALSQRIEYSGKAIQAYRNVIEGARRDMANLPGHIEELKQKLKDQTTATAEGKEKAAEYANSLADESKRHLTLINKVENAKNAIARLARQQQEAAQQQRVYNGVLERSRSLNEGLAAGMKSYSTLLKEQGLESYTTSGRVKNLRSQHELLKEQYGLEVAQTERLQGQIKELSRSYQSEGNNVQSLKVKLKEAEAEENRMALIFGKTSTKYKDTHKNVVELKDSLESSKLAYSGYRNGIYETTAELQKQTAKTSETATSVRKLKAQISSLHAGKAGALVRPFVNFDAKLKASTTHTRAWARSVRSSLAWAGAGFGLLAAGMGKSVSMAANLQQSWVTTRNLLQTGARNASEAAHEVGRVATMQRDAAKYSKQYGYSQKEVADQYTELVKRGYTANQSLGSMKSMLQAARASGDDFGDVVKNVSSTVDAFGMRTNNTSKMIERTRRVTNSMAYAADMTSTDFKGMGDAMSYVSASAHQAGQTVETTTAAIGQLSNAGIEGSRAGTGMRKMLMSLVKPTKGANEALQKYGMTMADFKNKDGSLKQLPDIMRTINKHVGKLGKADKGAFFKAVFGATGQQAAMVLSQNADAMDKLIKQEKQAEKNNYVQNLAKKNMSSTKMQMKQLKMQVQAFAIQIGSVLLPAVNKVGQAIGKWAQSSQGKATLKEFSDSVKATGTAIANHAGSIISFFGGFAKGLMDSFKAVNFLLTPLKKLVGWIAKLSGHSGNAARAFGTFVGAIAGVTVAVKTLKGLFGGVSAIIQDGKTLFGLDKQTSAIREQDRLYERMIELQEESLRLTQQQATQQTGNIESLAGNVATTETTTGATSVAENGASTAAKTVTESGMINAGEKAGTSFLAGFMTKAGRLNRMLLGLILPEGFLDVGSKVGLKLLAGIGRSFRFVGSKLLKPLLTIGNFGKTIGSKFASLFVKAGSKISSVFDALKTSQVGQFTSRWIVPETFKKIGVKSAQYFKAGFSKARIVFHPTQWFKTVEPAAKEAGAKSGSQLAEGLATTAKSSRFAGIGKLLAKGIADPLMLALGAIDIMRAWNTSKHKERAKKVGGAVGNLAGMAAGAKIGAALGSAAGPIGTAVGGALGAIIGGVAGTKIGKTLGPSLSKFWKGTVKTFDLIFKKHDWKGMWDNLGKSWKSFWRGMGNWWDQVIGKKTKGSSKSKKKTSKTETRYKGTKVKYSKSDVATLKAMTKAIDSYKSSLKSLKSTVKNNDPTKEMNGMLSKLKGSVKGWDKLAKPIKKIGDAFKTLATFSRSMAKKDAFSALNEDLPKLASTLSKHGKTIKNKLNDLGKAFASKKLLTPLKHLTTELKKSISTWKKFTTPVKSLAKSFNTFQKATKVMTGKNGLEAVKNGFSDLDTALSKQKIGSHLKTLGNQITESKITKKLSGMNDSVKSAAKYWKQLANPMNKAAKAFDTTAKSVDALNGISTGKKGKSKAHGSGLSGVTDNVKNLYNAIKKYPFGDALSKQISIANNAMNGKGSKNKKGSFADQFIKMTNDMTSAIKDFGKAFKHDWKQPWENLEKPVNDGLGDAYNAFRRRIDDIQDKRSNFSNSFLKGWRSWIDDVKTSFRRGFDKLPDYAESAMRKIVDKMNRGIGGVNKVISDFGGDKKLSTISYANGTHGGHPGGHMLVNDGNGPHWKELVKFPGKAWTMFKDRNTLIPNAPQGTKVVNGEQTFNLMSRAGIAAYADGTDDDDTEKLIEQMEKNPLATLKNIFFKATSFNGAPVISSFGTAMADGFLNAIKDKMKQMAKDAEDANSAAGTMSKAAFRRAAEQAARIMHQSLSDHDIERLYHQAYTESNVNPAQGGGIDDHDGTGRPIGLFQFKLSTWASAMRHVPANHHNIHNAVDQIAAVLADSTWRSDIEQLGQRRGWTPHGYANGGFPFSEQFVKVAEGGLPEAIIPFDINKRPRAQAILRKTVETMENDGGGSGLRMTSSSRETNNYLKQVVAILGKIAGLNAEQVDALLSIQPGTNLNNRRERNQFYNHQGSDQRIRDFQAF